MTELTLLRLAILESLAPSFKKAKYMKDPDTLESLSLLVGEAYCVRYELCDEVDMTSLFSELMESDYIDLINEAALRFIASYTSLMNYTHDSAIKYIATLLSLPVSSPNSYFSIDTTVKDTGNSKVSWLCEAFKKELWFFFLASLKLSGIYLQDIDEYINWTSNPEVIYGNAERG